MKWAASRAAASLPALLLLVGVASCVEGPGSDIGPRLQPLPGETCRVLVLDDQNRGVAAAVVQLPALGLRAASGKQGRAELFADPRGRQLVLIDGSHASATDGDRLGQLSFAVDLPGAELPYTVHLPDTAASAAVTVATGVLLPGTTVDDTASSGIRLDLAPGTVASAAGATGVTLRTGRLQRDHLPGDLPPATTGPRLLSRGIYIDPPAVALTPPASLSVPDDLSLPSGGTAELYHLDALTGEWRQVPGVATASGGRLQFANAVEAGGLYVFATAVPGVGAEVRGRLIGVNNNALSGLLLRVDGRRTRSGGDGRFAVADLAPVLADGQPRTVTIEVAAGAFWLPVAASFEVSVGSGAVVDAGDLSVDTVPAGMLRVQQIREGRPEALRRFSASSLDAGVAAVTFTDENGQAVVDDLPAGYFGYIEANPSGRTDVWYASAIPFFVEGRTRFDLNQFFVRRAFYRGTRSVEAVAIDALGGGPLRDVAFVTGSVPGEGDAGRSRENGTIVVNRDFAGRGTGVRSTTREGRTVVHAFTYDQPDNDRLEFPLEVSRRTPRGAFDRHALVAGTLVGADPLRQQRLRSTRRIELREWWDDVTGVVPIQSSLPLKVDPAVTFGSFRVGVAVPAGQFVVAETSTAGGVATLHRLGARVDLKVGEGSEQQIDLPLQYAADQWFAVPDALLGLDPLVAVADLRFDLALLLPNGRVVDCVRTIGGNHAAVGSGLQFLLPALAGPLAGHRWLVALSAAGTAGGVEVQQRSLLELAGSGAETPVPLQPAPEILAPLPGAAVAADGFEVAFTVPPGTTHSTIELRSETSTDLLLWQVVVRPTVDRLSFWRLPAAVPTPLRAGRTYQLTVRSHRSDDGLLPPSPNQFREIVNFWWSLGAAERGENAIASRSITITAN